MATTTSKSTKKKTASKATKKPAVKSATRTSRAAAGTTKKTVSAKAPKATSKSISTGAQSGITQLQVISLVLSAALATAAAVLMNTQAYQLVKGMLAKNELASASDAALVPAVTHVIDLELRWAVVGVMATSAVLSLIMLTVYKNRYSAAVKARVNGLRWAEIAITSALMVEVVALLSGINDIFVLKVIAGLVIVTCALGWVSEKRNLQANRTVKSELMISVLTGALPWLLILGYAASTYIHGRVTSPWYVYALYAVLIVGFTGYCLALKGFVYRRFTDYTVLERRQLLIGILTKVAFASILIAALFK